jgi:hypothetical protein
MEIQSEARTLAAGGAILAASSEAMGRAAVSGW